jgi:hypothetical protein
MHSIMKQLFSPSIYFHKLKLIVAQLLKKLFCLLQNTNIHVRFEVFTAVTMKKGAFWDVTPCGSSKNRRFGGTWRLHQGDKSW